ncbi:hypothetical protein [Haloquadratum walsbyi]|uniref:Uncharacterized protein n=1 Tax=Haloquadratum walsbyi (strain DSM 16790 / HBSQ001) TaxID=362976 RepID=Q18IF4_HALWD|nr:hypothetical protein [Haloquadratum walsbyi]CAJ52218.1 uncharacterized protein HQ_2091A [Haloquadratum walsbyi DSM 16790]
MSIRHSVSDCFRSETAHEVLLIWRENTAFMPSRRSIIASLGALTLSGFGAWFWLTSESASGYVQEKSIEARYREENQLHSESIITVTLSNPPGSAPPQLSWLHDDWQNQFDSPTSPVVSEALDKQLHQAYEDIRYIVGVCTPAWGNEQQETGCHNAPTSREEFNRVQVHNRVSASYTDTGLSIHRVNGTWAFDNP